MSAPLPRSPTLAASTFDLTLNSEDGEGNTTRHAIVSVGSTHPHDTHLAGNWLADLADLPARCDEAISKALLLIGAGQRMAAVDLLLAAQREARRIRAAGELEAS